MPFPVTPKISVCIPTYNRAAFVREAIESVLRQTRQDFEIIVFDDASTDATPEVVGQVDDDRVRYFRQERNVGVSANRNSCLAVARGEYIAWLDSDDVYLPHMLEAQSAVLDGHPGVGMVHGAFEVVDESGRRLPDWPRPFEDDVVEPGLAAFRELILSNEVATPTVMTRRDCQQRVGPYSNRLRTSGEDWDVWLRIALISDVAYTASPVAQVRCHPGSLSAASVSNGKRLRCDVRVVRGVFRSERRRIPEASEVEERAHAAMAAKALIQAGDACSRGETGVALRAAITACNVYPALAADPRSELLLCSIAAEDEYTHYRLRKELLELLHRRLADTRFGERIRKLALVDHDWQQALHAIAAVVREVVPEEVPIAVIDKWDPTLLHLSQRSGRHFPDLHLLPDGYPADDATAVAHLEQLRRLGMRYLVIPAAAFWWLEHYKGFAAHLNATCARVWHDDRCILFSLEEDRGGTVQARHAEGNR